MTAREYGALLLFGTGNSLYVARELQKRLPDTTLIPIVRLLDQEVIRTNGTSVGFVFPVQAISLPVAVRRFLRKVDLSSSDYLFAVATRAGTIFRGFETMQRLLKRKKRCLDAYFLVNMWGSDPRGQWKAPSEAELKTLESAVQERLGVFGRSS